MRGTNAQLPVTAAHPPVAASFAAAFLLWAHAGAAQQVRGTVVDSTSRRPIPGAVVTVLDSAGNILARNLSNERGVYALPLGAGARRVRVVRIGFRPAGAAVPPARDGVARADIAMLAIPTLLEPARVDARQCPARPDARQALGLWEQVRNGLLATIVAREANPGALKLIDFVRMMRGTSEMIDEQRIELGETRRSLNSYTAVRSAADFVKFGFNTTQDDGLVFFAPDADVLVDDAFANGYCFRLLRDPRGRTNRVGLGFSAPGRPAGRVDIDGALWVDTLTREVVDIEYRYVGVNRRVDEFRPGGQISFRTMPNGVAFIDRWQIRLVANAPDTIPVPMRPDSIRLRDRWYAVESGGEIAHATWPDGAAFHASLGRIVLTGVSRAGTPAVGRTVRFLETPYRNTLDSSGVFDAPDLLPGPYRLVVDEPRLRPLMLDTIPTGRTFVAARDSVHRATVPIPDVEDWIVERCVADRRFARGDTSFVLARVLDSSGQPVAGVDWNVEVVRDSGAGNLLRTPLLLGGRTGADGLLQVCTSRLRLRDRIIVVARPRERGDAVERQATVTGRTTIIPVVLPQRR